MDNALRCPQAHSTASEGFVQLIEEDDRTERQRRGWIMAHRVLGDAAQLPPLRGLATDPPKWLRDMNRKAKQVCTLEAVVPIVVRH